LTSEAKALMWDAAKPVGITVVALALGVMLAPDAIRPIKVTIAWDKNADAITEVWASTNLVTWYLKSNVVGSVATFPADLAQEFYKVRNSNQFGVSDWARK